MKEILVTKITEALKALQAKGRLSEGALPSVQIDRPKDEQFGEYTSNIALLLAKQTGENPRVIAEMIAEKVEGEEIGKVEVAGPGHLNFYVSQKAFTRVVEKILEEKERYGNSNLGEGKKVNNEFISANPTGPLHLGNARGGFLADALTNVLRKTGYQVTNEYLVNDGGQQIIKLGHSVLKDTEAVYGGEYIDALHEKYGKEEDVKEVGEKAAEEILEEYIKPVIKEKLQISFDSWVSEKKDLSEKGYIEKAIQKLVEGGYTYEAEGALWFKSTDFGDDKDRVLKKSDGSFAYIAPDCGYFLQKIERGFDMMILSLGADHHGYIKRLKAAAKALGFQGDFQIIISQLVRLVKNGEEVRMSKRAGNVVTAEELIDRVGHDVARFFMLMYAPGTHMNFDLGLAEERSAKNPVFYVQYAHARLASILRKASEENLSPETNQFELLAHPKERELMRELLFFPELVETIATEYSVQKLPQYAIRLADKLHSFYDECRVIDTENFGLSRARLGLIMAVKVVLGNTLALMGIQAPEKM